LSYDFACSYRLPDFSDGKTIPVIMTPNELRFYTRSVIAILDINAPELETSTAAQMTPKHPYYRAEEAQSDETLSTKLHR